jgi:hypothetical protein
MSRTTFSGPVKSDNGFEGSIAGDSAVITNLLCTTLTIGSTVLTTGSVLSGTVGATQLGYIPA